MPPIRVNRRHFLGGAAAAGLTLAQGGVEGAMAPGPIRLGLIGLGNRGTALLREALGLPGVEVVAVADAEPKHRARAQGIAERATGRRPEAYAEAAPILERPDVRAVLVALPCDLHACTYLATIRAGKHLYAEKPLGLTVAECDALVQVGGRAPSVVVHVGFQRRSNPRYRDGVALARSGALGDLLEVRAQWISSNGPVSGHGGWLARRERSGDWMVEQAVHVWDLCHWVAGGPPSRAFGLGRRDVFPDEPPGRDVTDHYSALLEWPGGLRASLVHSWADPADDAFTGVGQRLVGTLGGLDFATGVATFRDRGRPRQVLHPGAVPDTRLALEAFLAAVRADEPPPPPVGLAEARDATITGLMVRRAVDEGRVVTRDEVMASA